MPYAALVPRIFITGLPNRLQATPALRSLLVDDLPLVFEQHPVFAISRDDVSCHAAPDMVDDRTLRIVTFNVEGLLRKPERTPEANQALCDAIADVLVAFLTKTGAEYDSLVGWCLRIERDEDAFVRRVPS
jgi:hypothetical protein